MSVWSKPGCAWSQRRHNGMTVDRTPVLDVVNTLRSRGHAVEPDETFEPWRVDQGLWISDEQLTILAVVAGLRDGPGRAQ